MMRDEAGVELEARRYKSTSKTRFHILYGPHTKHTDTAIPT